MKIKKFKSKHLLKLYLLKSRAQKNSLMDKKSNFYPSTNISLTRVLWNFKKALKIIFKYHRLEKRIIFVGLPNKLQYKINFFTRHVAVTENFNFQHFLYNTDLKASKTNLVKKQFTKGLLPKLARKPDLFVFILTNNNNNSLMLFKDSRIKSLTIVFNNTWVSNLYNVTGVVNPLSETLNENLFSIGLNFLFKNFVRKSAVKKSRLRQSSSSKRDGRVQNRLSK